MLKSLESRIKELESQAAPADETPDVIFLVGIPVGEPPAEAYQASTGHLRTMDESEQQFLDRIAADVGIARNPVLVTIECRPVGRQAA